MACNSSAGVIVFAVSTETFFTVLPLSELNLSDQPAGLYMIKVTKGDKIYNGKIVLQ
ncbi:MAG: T9SS type A sorting domain-containing protein [Bacteroidetes bacterium]|nr:T9SS type A sorting domain-containing protein [Bacteroidota bacterium]